MKKNTLKLLGLTLLLAACGDSDPNQGRVSMAITDAPVDGAEAVVLAINSVTLQGNGEDQVFLLDPAVSINLLDLQGDKSEFLISDVTVPSGVYTHIQFGIDAIDTNCNNRTGEEASYITISGVSYPIGVPSGELKINKPLTIAAGGQASYTVDFDLRKALAERGSTGCYNINPTALRVVDNAEVGTLTGTVDASLLVSDACPNADFTTGAGAAVYVFAGTDVSPTDFNPEPLTTALLAPEAVAEGEVPTGNFTYTVGFLLAADYTVALTCMASEDVPEQDDAIDFLQQANVSIITEQTSTVTFTAAP